MIGRRLLMGGGGSGSFAPPVYTGVLTAGAISTITDDSYYNAWPVICRLANGNLLLAYTKAICHHCDTSGNAVMKTSTDDGATWSAESSIYFDTVTPYWATIMGISQISTGRIFASLWRDNYPSVPVQAGYVYSDNNGSTWSGWQALTTSFTTNIQATGPVVELPGGNLLISVEGQVGADTLLHDSVHTLKSTDQGVTWGSEVTVRNYATDTRPYYESKLVLLDTGDLLCVHRCAATPGLPHYISTSTDDGATWGAPVAQFAGVGAPSTMQASWGTLLSVTRRDSDSATIAYTSIDRGTTWSSAYVLDATMYEMEYGCPVQTLDGRWLVVYGYQPTSSITNADIKQIYVAEGTS